VADEMHRFVGAYRGGDGGRVGDQMFKVVVLDRMRCG
jgi:hypothetical protein